MTIPKFRVYDKVECMMITTSDYEDLSDLFCFLKADADTGYYSELMQSTGMVDKNDKEIFEGDIVKVFDKDLYVVEWSSQEASYKLIPVDKQWSDCYFSNYENITKIIEVVGNIYENLELLEEVEC